MIKKTITKLLCGVIAAGTISVAVPGVSAMAMDKNNQNNKPVVTKEINQEDLQQLTYAVEEMRIAVNHLENDNLLDNNILNRLLVFGKTSVDRERGLNLEENNEFAPHVEWIESSLERLHDSYYRVSRISNEIEKCKIIFSEDDMENKEAALYNLNEVISQEMESGELNEATLRSAINTLHYYAAQVPGALK